MAHKTIRIDETTLSHAQRAIEVTQRSLSGQVAYWMNIGRIIEASGRFDMNRIEAALRAEFDVDQLSDEEREVFEIKFEAYMSKPDPDLDAQYKALGEEGLAKGYDLAGETEADLY